ncbi:MAG: hypothetical protein ACRC37_08135, partial [Lentisphaeria bacterium]
MKDLNAFKEFCSGQLVGNQTCELQEQIDIGKSVNRIFVKVLIISIFLSMVAYLFSQNSYSIVMPIIVALIWIVMHNSNQTKITAIFKNVIVRKIITFISPTLKYYPQEAIHKSLYFQSEIFNQRLDRYVGEDLVTGKYNDVD